MPFNAQALFELGVRPQIFSVKAAAQLIAGGTCTRKDFKDMGGWMKSVNQYRDRPVYFTYCGGMTSANKIYLDASTGKTFR